MGDKGKKDKDKARKQKIKRQVEMTKTNPEKLPAKIPYRNRGRWWRSIILRSKGIRKCVHTRIIPFTGSQFQNLESYGNLED